MSTAEAEAEREFEDRMRGETAKMTIMRGYERAREVANDSRKGCSLASDLGRGADEE